METSRSGTVPHIGSYRNHVAQEDIEVFHVGTKKQLADIFTKPLDEARFRELRHELNIMDLSNMG